MPRTRQGQPVRSATGQPYGQRKQLEEAQSAMPVAADPIEMALNSLGDFQRQGPGLMDPSEYPDMPMTAGLPIGAGPGPEMLGPPPPQDDPALTPDMVLLAPMLPMLEQLASRPGSSQATRNFVRTIRANLDPRYSYTQSMPPTGETLGPA